MAIRRRHSGVSFDAALAAYREWIGWRSAPILPPKGNANRSANRKIIIANDFHSPFQNDRAIREMVRNEAADTDTLVVAGDLADMFNFSRHDKFRQHFTPLQELYATQKVLVTLAENFREVLVLPGNHDKRMVKRLVSYGVPPEMLDYMEALAPNFTSPLKLMAAPLHNVRVVEPAVADYANFDFLHQIGDLIITHAEKYSRIPAKAATEVLKWLKSFAEPRGIVKPFKVVAQAHTHGAGKVWSDYGCWALELGCMCLTADYLGDPKILTPRPWITGYTVVHQTNGITDINRTNFIAL